MKANSTYRSDTAGPSGKGPSCSPHVCGNGFRHGIIMTPPSKVYGSVLCLGLLQHVLIKLSYVVTHYVFGDWKSFAPVRHFPQDHHQQPWPQQHPNIQHHVSGHAIAISFQHDCSIHRRPWEHRSTGAQDRTSRSHFSTSPCRVAAYSLFIGAAPRFTPRDQNPQCSINAILRHHVTDPSIEVSWSACRGDGHQMKQGLQGHQR